MSTLYSNIPSVYRYVESTRQSNIELLRIVAMFLVLVLHSGFFSIECPTTAEVHEQYLQPFTRFVFQSFSISCVDVFVLISGWFGIRPTKRGLLKFLFQSFYFIAGIYLVMVICGRLTLTADGIASCFLFIKDYDYWFVRTYLLLFIISPILNAFVDLADRYTFRNILVGFFLFQTIYAWVFVSVNAFAGGYSTISFMGLYLLARYVFVYNPDWSKWSIGKDLLMIISCVFLMATISFMTAYFGHSMAGKFCDRFICPLVIILSLYMVIMFSKFKVQSKIINWVSASCFAVYLFHTHITILYDYFKPTVIKLYSDYEGITCLGTIGLFLLIMFSLAIILDQPRKYIWRVLSNKLL